MDLRKPAGGLVQFKKFLISKGVGISLGPIPELISDALSAAAAKEHGEKSVKQHAANLIKIWMKLCTIDDADGIRIEEKLPFMALAQQIAEFFFTHLSPLPAAQVDVAPLASVIAELRKLAVSWIGNYLRQSTIDEGTAALDALGPSVLNRLFNAPECAEERVSLSRVMPLASDRVLKHGFLKKRARYSQNTQVRYCVLVLRSYVGPMTPKDEDWSPTSQSPGPSSPRSSGAVRVSSPQKEMNWRDRIRSVGYRRTRDSSNVTGNNYTNNNNHEKGREKESYGEGEWRESPGLSRASSDVVYSHAPSFMSSPEERISSPHSASRRSSDAGANRVVLVYFSEAHVKTVELSGYRTMSETVPSSTGPRYQLSLCPPQEAEIILLESFTKECRDEWMAALKEVGLLSAQLSAEEVKEREHPLLRATQSLENVVETTISSAKRVATHHQGPIGAKRNDMINKIMESDQAAGKLMRTCAVFGSPLSGALAIMRSVLKLHGTEGYRQETAHLPAIRKAMWDNLRTIAAECYSLPNEVANFCKMHASPDADLPMAAKVLKLVWGCAEVQEVFGARKKELMPNLAYFLDRVDCLYEDGYTLTEEDLNKCSLAHVGTSVEKFSFKLRSGEFQFVHPQTTLSTKMLLTFDRIGFLVWVVSLVDWEQVDPKTGLPYLRQDRRDFKRVCNLEPFSKVPVVCFLNWSRTFLSRLKNRKAVEKFKMLYSDERAEDETPKYLLDCTVQRYRSMIDPERRCLVQAVSGVESAVTKLVKYAVDLNFNQALEKIGLS